MTTSETIHDEDVRITLIGAGTIGLSFAALHLSHLRDASRLTIFDTRDDLASYIKLATSLPSAVGKATIIQEQGPENAAFKTAIWAEIEEHAPEDALFWSSTSGIPASVQSQKMKDASRLLVVHPYNPPHIMPLLEVVPSPSTSDAVVERTVSFWRARGRTPVVVKKECTGFVANRLAFALLRESIHLVRSGVVTVEELDRIVETSMGPRWAVAGPFKSYHAGGGAGGLEAFMKNIGGTVQACWDDLGDVRVGEGQGWEEDIYAQTREAYGVVDTGLRDRTTKRVLEVVEEEKSKG
ncbi:hypothetical protein H2199_000743 [Coniosporium tulheliwenetii]|uniref:Uncharacterized protein n=1 Tax=Coniosporium tulheliwenetii TaxID=3383036 RepID=A0ACC2ZML8_9PEZI|nr:hypothetical protein H2199_000743 [Cladosporium sp. JES 115]